MTEVLQLPPERVVLKVRRRQRGERQYDRLAEEGRTLVVTEGDAAFQVNLSDYLDTGLFLDQRLVRALLRELAPGRTFLNLFGYTGTATVAAARGGASGSLTLDLSATYLDWARRNFQLNGLDPRRHELLRADCLPWLAERSRDRGARRFGLIYLAPPTFSNSKRMGDLDLRRAARPRRPDPDGGRAAGAGRRAGLRGRPPQLSHRSRRARRAAAHGPLARHAATGLRAARPQPPRLAHRAAPDGGGARYCTARAASCSQRSANRVTAAILGSPTISRTPCRQ